MLRVRTTPRHPKSQGSSMVRGVARLFCLRCIEERCLPLCEAHVKPRCVHPVCKHDEHASVGFQTRSLSTMEEECSHKQWCVCATDSPDECPNSTQKVPNSNLDTFTLVSRVIDAIPIQRRTPMPKCKRDDRTFTVDLSYCTHIHLVQKDDVAKTNLLSSHAGLYGVFHEAFT